MSDKEIIKKVEEKWLSDLYRIIKKEFETNPLPSHDHTHHYRVWCFARELITTLSENGFSFSQEEIEKIIIAVFFHDLGLTVTRGAKHGRESRKLCERFILSCGHKAPMETDEMFYAVENHDDKTYPLRNQEKPNGIYTILTVSDDLDAFGATGVYRYLEIYYLRKISPEQIPLQAAENVNTRFGYFKTNYRTFTALINRHEHRKDYTFNFFMNVTENRKIMEHLITAIIEPGLEIEEIFKKPSPLLQNAFFLKLRDELDQFEKLV